MRERIKHATFLIVPTVIVLLAVEGVARLMGLGTVVSYDSIDAAYQRSPTLGWERRPGFRGNAEGGFREFDSRALFRIDSADLAAATGPGVFVFGASATFGFGVPTESTYTEGIQSAFADVHAINLGIAKYSSYQVLVLLKRMLESYRPSVVIVEVGMHDRGRQLTEGPDGPDVFRAQYGGWIGYAATSMMHSHAFRAANATLMRRRRESEERTCATVDPGPRVELEAFESNLLAIDSAARKNGARVVFLFLGASVSAEQLFRKGEILMEGGDYQAAIPALLASMDSDNWSFKLRAQLHLMQSYRKGGQSSQAATLICVPPDEIGATLPESTYVRRLHEVASNTGSSFVDFSRFDRRQEDFSDDNHLSVTGHARVGRLLAAEVARALGRPVNPAWVDDVTDTSLPNSSTAQPSHRR